MHIPQYSREAFREGQVVVQVGVCSDYGFAWKSRSKNEAGSDTMGGCGANLWIDGGPRHLFRLGFSKNEGSRCESRKDLDQGLLSRF